MEWEYSDDFKRRVLAAHANNPYLPEIKKALEAGSLTLGRYLDDGVTQIKPEDILACHTIEEAHALARRVEEQRNVWREFQMMMRR